MKGFLYSIVAGIATLTLSAVTLWADTIDIPEGESKTYNEVAGNTITGAGTIKVDNVIASGESQENNSTNVSSFLGTVDICGDTRYLMSNQIYLGTNVNYTVSGYNQLWIQAFSGTIKSLSISSQGKSNWGGGLRLTNATLSVTDGITVTGNTRLSNISRTTSTLNSDITIADGCTLGFDTGWGDDSSSNFAINGSITGANSALTFGENYSISHTNGTYTLGKGKDGTSSGTYNVKSISALAGSKVNFDTGTIITDTLSAESTATLTMDTTNITAKTISNAGTMTQKGGKLTPGGEGTVGTTTIQSGTYTLSSSSKNLALNKTATSLNGAYGGFPTSQAVDGNTGTCFISLDGGSVQDHAFIVDLGSTYTLNSIWYRDREVNGYNPMEDQSGNYFQFYMYDADNNLTYTSEQFTNYTSGGTTYNLGNGATGQYLKIVEHVPRSGEGNTYFEIAELQPYSNATLSFDLGSGDNYDKLVINSGATLKLDNANLAVNLLDSFNPETTSSFQILDIQGTLDGTFSSMTLPSTWGDKKLQWNTDSLYSAGTLSVQAIEYLLYPVKNSWNTALTVDGTTCEGMRFDSTTADAGVTEATHTGGLTLNSDAIINVGEGYTLTEASTGDFTGRIIKTGTGTAIIKSSKTEGRAINALVIDGGLLQIANSNGGNTRLTATDAITFGDNGGTLDAISNFYFENSSGFKITTSAKSNNQNYITSTGSSSDRGLNIGGGKQILTVNTPTNGDLEISARIWNGGKLVKTGTGTLTLSGVNNVSNPYSNTEIQEGTLKLAGDGTLGSGSVTIGANGTLEINVAAEASKTVTNSFSGAGTIKKTGAGEAYLTNNTSRRDIGSIVIDGGFLQIANAGGSIRLTSTDAIIFGDNGGTLDSPHNFYFENSSGFKITTSAKSNNQNYITSTGSDGDRGLNIGANNYTLTVETPTNGDLEISAQIWNGGKLIKTGTGTLTLSGVNRYSKGTEIQTGTLKVTGSGTLGTGTTTISDGTKLEFNVASGQTKKIVLGGTQDGYARFYSITGTDNSQIVKSGDGVLKILLAAQDQITADKLVVSSGRLDIKSTWLGDNYAALDADLEVLGGAYLSPGNSIGTLALDGDLTLQDGSTLILEVGKDESGKIVTDTLSIAEEKLTFTTGSIIRLDLDSETYTPQNGDIIELNIPQKLKDALNNNTVQFSSYYFKTYNNGSSGFYVGVDPNAVPEPSTWALLILGFAGLIWYRKIGRR